MSRIRIPIAAGLAVGLTMLVPPGPAGAQQDDGGGDKATVEVSTRGSYIVVMEADPLVADRHRALLDRIAGKGALTMERLPERHAEAELIAPGIDVTPPHLLQLHRGYQPE